MLRTLPATMPRSSLPEPGRVAATGAAGRRRAGLVDNGTAAHVEQNPTHHRFAAVPPPRFGEGSRRHRDIKKFWEGDPC